MSRAYTENDLADQLDSDLTWRVKELSDLKNAISKNDVHAQSVLLRSLVTMLYAHWEGHIRFCVTKYFEHVTLRRRQFSQLERQLYLNNFLARLDGLHRSRISISERCELIAEILDSLTRRFSRINPSLIDTRSNLSSEVLKDLCLICSIDFAYFEAKKTFIDVILLKRRNSIAHGEELDIRSDEQDELVAEGVSLMRVFKDAIQNKVFTRTYLIA